MKKTTMTAELAQRLATPWQMTGMEPHTPVLLALSGGADSAALLHILAEQAVRDGFPLLLCHLDHGIRGAEAERDAAFCRTLAEQYGLELVLRRAEIPQISKKEGTGLEETARKVRYAFFEEVMRERQIPLLATAHHADDQLETVLFRLGRGTGLSGLCGIPGVRSFAGGFVTRPMLKLSRREILAYCREKQLAYVTDSTNADPAYTRNRLRLCVIPELEKAMPGLRGSVARMTETLAQDRDLIEGLADAFLAKQPDPARLCAEELKQLHPALRRRVLSRLLPKRPEAVHLAAMEALLQNGRSGDACSLPGGYRACLQNGCLTVLPPLHTSDTKRTPFGEGALLLCDGGLTVSVRKTENSVDATKVHNLSTDSSIILRVTSAIMLELHWRLRLPGDRLWHNGVHRELRRLWREAGIPPALREALPLLCDSEGILWAPYIGLRDGYPQTEGDSYTVTLQIQK